MIDTHTRGMLKSLFSFSKKTHPFSSDAARRELIKSFIVQRQTKEFCAYLRRNEDRMLCFQGFFQLLPKMLDDQYLGELFEIMLKKSRLKPAEISKIISDQLSSAIREKNFLLCEKILYLPFQSFALTLPTFEFIQFIHNCFDSDQLIRCISKLIEKNLPHDSEYLSWVLIILFEHYRIGDEILIEHLLNLKTSIDLLCTCYGNSNVTPLMLFFHLYANETCQNLLNSYLSNIPSTSVLLQCDTWNRSYLMHLLCARCEHALDDNDLQCPHSSTILSRFAMLDQLGNRFDTPMKSILTSDLCFPLRMTLIKAYLAMHPTSEIPLNELFQYFPSKYLATYRRDLQQMICNRNCNSVLTSQLQRADDTIIGFLLTEGARCESLVDHTQIIVNLLADTRSFIPFLLLDYSFHVDVPFNQWSTRRNPRMNLYICRVLQCGYPSEFRTKFDQFKSQLSEQTVKEIEKFVDLKNTTSLSKLCLQKLRSSLKHLGDETIDRLKDHLPVHLRQSIVRYGYDQCQPYFQSVLAL